MLIFFLFLSFMFRLIHNKNVNFKCAQNEPLKHCVCVAQQQNTKYFAYKYFKHSCVVCTMCNIMVLNSKDLNIYIKINICIDVIIGNITHKNQNQKRCNANRNNIYFKLF